jgi:hypothetical protein
LAFQNLPTLADPSPKNLAKALKSIYRTSGLFDGFLVQFYFIEILEKSGGFWQPPGSITCRFFILATGVNLPKTLKNLCFSEFFRCFSEFLGLFPYNFKRGQICTEWPFLGKYRLVGHKKISSFFQLFAHV